jgi:hypothetical protein
LINNGDGTFSTGASSAVISTTTLDLSTVPIPPSDFKAVVDGKKIHLTWTDNSTEGGFSLARVDNASGPIFDIILPANTTSYEDSIYIFEDVHFVYYLRSVNEFGYGGEVVSASAFIPSTPPIIPPPVARLATFVAPTTFTANWEEVEGVESYQLYVFCVNDSTVLAGYDGLMVSGTSKLVTATKPSRQYAYYLKAVIAEQTSEKSNVILVAPIKGLTLHAVCSDDPSVFRRWEVINNNDVPLEISWYVNNTVQTGIHLATPGESYFTTETISGLNKVTITWYNDNLRQFTSTKPSSAKSCGDNNAIALANVRDEQNGDQALSVEAFPNPVNDKVQIRVTVPPGKEIEIQIVDFSGRKMFVEKVICDTTLEVNVSTYAPGIYIVKANQFGQFRTLKVIKK